MLTEDPFMALFASMLCILIVVHVTVNISVTDCMLFLATERRNLLYYDADTEEGSSGSPVIVAERLQRQDGSIKNGLTVIALHTEAADGKKSNIATLLTPLIRML